MIVEGLNVNYLYIGKTDKFPGTMIMAETPLLVTSEVALVDPSDKYVRKKNSNFLHQPL